MIRAEVLPFPPLHCSLEAPLGDYYQDLSSALVLVESGYHGGLDENGVPLVRHGAGGLQYNPIVTAQYALANLTALRGGDQAREELTRTQLEWLVAAQEVTGRWAGCWFMTHDNQKYPWLKAPWTSALASGNAISALLRGWDTFGDDRYRAAADAAYEALHRPELRLADERGDALWYEEYPAEPPMRVLNGHVYTLLGVLDYARATGEPHAVERWRRAATTVREHLGGFDLGYWSAYDLRWREPAARHYHKNIHVPQLRILAALMGDRGFGDVADRWERQIGSVVSRVRWEIALRIHARRVKR